MPPARRLAVAVAFVAVLLLLARAWRNVQVPVGDFSAYWVAGHALLEHGNPYDSHYALNLQHAVGARSDIAYVMRNPPWLLFLTVPLGLLSYSSAWLLWNCALIVSLAVSARLVWTVYGGRASLVPLFVTFAFAPTLACLSVGQTAPLVLLGIAAFLRLQSRHEFCAGLALVLAAAKPQLLLPFWLLLLIWSVQARKWRIIAGAATGAVLSTAIAMLFDHAVVTHFFRMLPAESIQMQFIPSLGGWLRWMFGPPWLQVAPAFVGIAWAVAHYVRHRSVWRWEERLPMLLVSVLVAPYAWLLDEVVILPALLIAALRLLPNAIWRVPFAVAFAAVNAGIVVALISGIRIVSPYYVWTVWIWLAFFLLAGYAQPSCVSKVLTGMSSRAQQAAGERSRGTLRFRG